MINRKIRTYNGAELLSETFKDYTWEEVRTMRDEHLMKCDWRFMSDQTPSQKWTDYRKFLRDLPQNYYDEDDEVSKGANEACDAWMAYEIPE